MAEEDDYEALPSNAGPGVSHLARLLENVHQLEL